MRITVDTGSRFYHLGAGLAFCILGYIATLYIMYIHSVSVHVHV